MFRKQDTKIHFVGIGGMGMCGIAEVLANMGYRVSGSDMNDTEITRHLAKIGCTVKQGHRADNLGEADVVVVSSAIKGYNPEVEAARARQIPVIPRAEMLGELMRMKYGIAVAGAQLSTLHQQLVAALTTAPDCPQREQLLHQFTREHAAEIAAVHREIDAYDARRAPPGGAARSQTPFGEELLERLAPYVLPCEDRDDLVKALFEAGFRPADR